MLNWPSSYLSSCVSRVLIPTAHFSSKPRATYVPKVEKPTLRVSSYELAKELEIKPIWYPDYDAYFINHIRDIVLGVHEFESVQFVIR